MSTSKSKHIPMPSRYEGSHLQRAIRAKLGTPQYIEESYIGPIQGSQGYILSLQVCKEHPNFTHQQVYDMMHSSIYSDFKIKDEQIAAAIQDYVRDN
jgi:hypothetical protein